MSQPDLLALTADLVAIPSVSRSEGAIASRIVALLEPAPWLRIERIGDNIVARTSGGKARHLLLAGHIDTVPPAGNEDGVVDDGVCRGVGSVDMKGGVAVLVSLAVAGPPGDVDLTFVFYACEEVDRAENGLRMLARDRPELLACDTAILAEPTGGVVEAGCQGSLRAELRLGGVRAHTARPWMGRNAIHRLGEVLSIVDRYEGRRPVIDGCEYRESLQAVGVEGGLAGNVVPDSARLIVNHRFAPDVTVDEAVGGLRALFSPLIDDGQDSFDVLDATSGAPPSLASEELGRLVKESGAAPRAKLGLTDVSLFAEMGIPAANFGPGDPTLAHGPHEQISSAELDHTWRVLASVIDLTSS